MFSMTPWKKRQDVPAKQQESHPLVQFRREWDQLWDRFFSDFGDMSLWEESPSFGSFAKLEDEENQYVVRAEMPGFEPDEIDVKVSGNVMTICAEHKQEKKEGNGSSYRYGRFRETFTLPQGVLSDKIDARYRSGVLEIQLPKSEEAQAKRIEVKSS